ncbi:MAG: N-acetyl-gamma-glutamyl-phosphate reductase [Planctomycetaceae bacterium]
MAERVRVAILGATGYTALELIRILLNHPQVSITALSSRRDDQPAISEVHPRLHGRLNLPCERLSPAEAADRADFVFCALPHGASMVAVPELLAAGTRVIDLSADYRLDDPEVYRRWYGLEHTDAERMASTVYGLPEIGITDLKHVDLVANPGCYTSTSILGLAPLLSHNLIEPAEIIIDAKSGVSGAGRVPKLETLYAECNESLSAYAVGSHRHTPEIDQVLTAVSGETVEVLFTPHLVPMHRGILCTMYARRRGDCTSEQMLAAMRDYYADRPFIRVVDHLPRTIDVSGTNYCDMTVRCDRRCAIVLSTTDNLIKGAAGVAVQNLNLMAGFPEEMGLLSAN